MIKYIYRDEKSALRDLRVVLGHASGQKLGNQGQLDLARAMERLGSLPGGDVLDLVVKMNKFGLAPIKPQIEIQAGQSISDFALPGH